jgi:hypothetical protein
MNLAGYVHNRRRLERRSRTDNDNSLIHWLISAHKCFVFLCMLLFLLLCPDCWVRWWKYVTVLVICFPPTFYIVLCFSSSDWNQMWMWSAECQSSVSGRQQLGRGNCSISEVTYLCTHCTIIQLWPLEYFWPICQADTKKCRCVSGTLHFPHCGIVYAFPIFWHCQTSVSHDHIFGQLRNNALLFYNSCISHILGLFFFFSFAGHKARPDMDTNDAVASRSCLLP